MAGQHDVQAILAALQGPSNSATHNKQLYGSSTRPAAQNPPAASAPQAQPPQPPSGVYNTATPPTNYPAYNLPQPSASGSVDLSSIKPVSTGNVNFQDALAKARDYASARGLQHTPNPHNSGMYKSSSAMMNVRGQAPMAFAAPPQRQDPRLANRSMNRRSRSRSPPRNYNPYRDERRDDPRRANGGGSRRDRSRSPSRGNRGTFSPHRDRDFGRD